MSDSIIDTPAAVKPFDYSTLDANTRGLAEMVRDNVRVRSGRAIEDMVEIGKQLALVRAVMPRQFLDWITREFGWGRQTAYNLMNVAERFPNFQALGSLEVTAEALYLLASPSVEPEAAEHAVVRASAGEKIDRRVAAKIANEVARAKGKPAPLKVQAKRKDAEPRSDAPPTTSSPAVKFTDDDNPFVEPPAASAPKPGVASEREVMAHERLAESSPATGDPWAEYNAQLDATIAVIQSAASAVESLRTMPGTSAAFGGWIDRAQWEKYFRDAVTLFTMHRVVGFASKRQQASIPLPDGQTFLYALDAKSKRGAA